jgi:CubicO group peptidase (beta-lactamase class C family)
MALNLCVLALSTQPVVAAAMQQAGSSAAESLVESPQQAVLWDPAKFFSETLGVGERLIPGGSAVLVESDEIAYQGSFGVVELGSEVLLRDSSFEYPVASVTKVFTAFAVLQLVAEGSLTLDASAAELLTELEIPPTVTVWHLLTHTSGLRDSVVGLLRPSGEVESSLIEVVRFGLPTFVGSPGEVYRYSNWNAMLLALIVERISGLDFESYMKEKVFLPIGMTESHFSSVSQSNSLQRVTGHHYDILGTGWRVVPDYSLTLKPSGGLVTTTRDMVLFLRFILSEEIQTHPIFRRMFEPEWVPYAHASESVSLAFLIRERGGQRFVMHDGMLPGFSSCLVLVPEKQTGYFVACNFSYPNLLGCWESFAEQRYGLVASQRRVGMGSDVRPGEYLPVRFHANGFEKLAAAFGFVETIFVGDEPVNFQVVTGSDDYIANGMDIYVRLRWYETPFFHFLVLAAAVAFSVIAIIVNVVGMLRYQPRTQAPWLHSSLLLCSLIAGIGVLSMLLVPFAFIGEGTDLLFGYPTLASMGMHIAPYQAGWSFALAVLIFGERLTVLKSRLSRSSKYWSVLALSASSLALVWLAMV